MKLVEYTAEIIKFVKVKDKLLLKYFFRDVKTSKEDWFLSDRKIGCVFNLAGKLILQESDDHPKFYKSFKQDKQDIINLTKEEEEKLIKLEEEPKKTKKTEDIKKTKINYPFTNYRK